MFYYNFSQSTDGETFTFIKNMRPIYLSICNFCPMNYISLPEVAGGTKKLVNQL